MQDDPLILTTQQFRQYSLWKLRQQNAGLHTHVCKSKGASEINLMLGSVVPPQILSTTVFQQQLFKQKQRRALRKSSCQRKNRLRLLQLRTCISQGLRQGCTKWLNSRFNMLGTAFSRLSKVNDLPPRLAANPKAETSTAVAARLLTTHPRMQLPPLPSVRSQAHQKRRRATVLPATLPATIPVSTALPTPMPVRGCIVGAAEAKGKPLCTCQFASLLPGTWSALDCRQYLQGSLA